MANGVTKGPAEPRRRLKVLALSLVALLLAILALGLSVFGATRSWAGTASANTASAITASCASVVAKPGWVGTWSASQIPANATDALSERGFHNQTLREVVHVSLGGTRLRIRLSNQYGKSPLIVDDVHVGLSRPDGAVKEPSSRLVTFSGASFDVINPGQAANSDPVDLAIGNLANLAVSIYLPGLTGPTTWDSGANTTSYTSRPGNFAGTSSSSGYTSPITAWYYLSGVDVYSPNQIGAVVALGDSITSGYNSKLDANATWPDYLAARIDAVEPPGQRAAVLNAGLDANQLLNGTHLGASAEDRFGTDVGSVTGIRTVILAEGTNDLRLDQGPHASSPLTAAELIRGMRDVVAQAHAHGLRIIGTTILPFQGDSPDYTPAAEATREAVNHWIRTSGAFNGVIDFDQALRDPADLARIRSAYGGPLHPNDAGYAAMARAVNLALLCP
ncbi:MAG: SGNH/GDSL hydrolase family protein [Acidimicrobiales bacterium]